MSDDASKFLEATSAYSFVLDNAGRLKSVSESWSRGANIPGSQFVGRRLEEMLPPSTSRFIHQAAGRVRMFGFATAVSKAFELAPGDVRHLHGELFKLDDDCIGFHAVDVTPLIEAQKLVESQRSRVVQIAQFAALSQLAAGIAQETNNPLAVIQGYAGVLRSHASQGKLTNDVVVHISQKIVGAVSRVSKIINNLQSFARESDRTPLQVMQVHGLVGEVLELSRERFIADGVQLDVRWRCEYPVVDARQAQLVQVVLNLLDNARDACASAHDKWVRLEVSELDENIVIAVEDSGHGIPPSLRQRIMEPFFSTKGEARSVGLGLSHSKTIVEQHGGVLTLRADHPHTRFEIYLPKREARLKAG